MTQVVRVDELRAALNGPQRVVVVDASAMDQRGQVEGIPGAVRFDIDGDLSRHDADAIARGAVHEMLPPEALQDALRSLGIRGGDRVVAYDAHGLFSAARAWWMLRNAGIDAAVLDGGLPAWRAAGLPMEPVRERLDAPGDVTVRWNPDAFVDADTVAVAAGDGATALLDARSRERYAGAVQEPRPGLRSGHIPGAASLPYTELQRDGMLLPVTELAARIQQAAGDAKRIVASCGSGVTACVIALAATQAGYDDVTVYDGSWAEWGRADSGRPVATEPTPPQN